MKSSRAITALVVALAAAGCEAAEETAESVGAGEQAPAAETTAPPVDATAPTAATMVEVADIVDNPTQYNGQTITVEADVEEVLSGQAFLLDEDDPLEGGVDNELMVLYPRSAALADIDDQWLNNRVRVTGTARAASVVDIEREIGWDLDQQMEVELEGTRPVLIAQTVQRL